MNQFSFIIHSALIQSTTGPLRWMKDVTIVFLSADCSYSVCSFTLHGVNGKQDICYTL